MSTFNTCRFCKEDGRRLFKYGTRHYAHAQCGFARFGIAFLDRIPQHELGSLPWRAVCDAGLDKEVIRRIEEHQ